MIGKIITYSSDSGNGKIITKAGAKLPFSVDDWMDFDNLPRVGALVSFEIGNERAVSIKQISAPKSQDAQNEQQDASGARGSEAQKRESATEHSRESKQPKKREASFRIKAKKSIIEVVNSYFEEYLETVQQNSEALGMNKSLDFFKMKRFLYTAYHNLRQLDRSITDERFRAIENELNSLQRLYENFIKMTNIPSEVAFEQVFLKAQPDYEVVAKRVGELKQRIDELTMFDRVLKDQIVQKEQQLSFLKPEDEAYNQTLGELKSLKRRDADVVYEISNNKEAIRDLALAISDFKNEYAESFRQFFEQNVTYYKTKMIKILDAKAYEFDYILWSNAKESPYIRKFFAECKIEGSYSSKTFLRYYIKTLDENKLTEENRKLFDLLSYLETSCTKRVAVVCKDADLMEKVKAMVEGIDKDFLVNGATSPTNALSWCKQNTPDVIIITFDLKITNAFEFVKSYFQSVKKSVITDVCVLYETKEVESLKNAEMHNIRYTIRYPVDDSTLFEQLKVIV